MSFKMDGFDNLQKELRELEQKSQELNDTQEISLYELFDNSFMIQYTKFNSFDEFLKAGNFNVESNEDFEAIPENELDQHVANNSNFEDWQDMLDTAGTEYFSKQLGF